jgi:hypothetical protein
VEDTFYGAAKVRDLAALVKPVTTEVLVRNLELHEEVVRFSSFYFLFYLSSNRHANAGSPTTDVLSKRAFSK